MNENCKSLVLQDKCNIEIFLSPAVVLPNPCFNELCYKVTALCSIIEDNPAGKADESKAKEKTGKAGAGTRKKRAAEETEKGKTEPPTSTTQFDQSTMLAPSASPNEGTDDVSKSLHFMTWH